MIGQNNSKSFKGFENKAKQFLNDRYPAMTNGVSDIHFEKGGIGNETKANGIYANVDSAVCASENTRIGGDSPLIRTEVSDSVKQYVDKKANDLVRNGVSEGEAKKRALDSIETVMGYDKATGQYVKSALIKGVNDSLLTQTSIPMWNIAWNNKVFRQPLVKSHAKNLVQIESFSNPWADIVGCFGEQFEGFGKLSTTARGNIKQNNANPVTNSANQIMSEVFNLSIDFENDPMEDKRIEQSGNFIAGILKADRQAYADMMLNRLHDALIYFGDKEAGMDGLVDVASVEQYSGTPLYDIMNDSSETAKGSKIVQAMNRLIGDFLRENHYMAREVKINCSEYVFEALTKNVYSDTYNPTSPIKILQDNFNVQNEMGEMVSVKFSITADTMCNPNTPWNPTNQDKLFITVPSISDAMGEQSSLVIAPELIKAFTVPALWQRSGTLFTTYRRVGSVIAPLEGTVKVVDGFGYQG